ncbi:MAG: hypothetical protein IT492_19325 [Gammaproteobacteria bacterium]|nr:hypothetical protein [Gammaproteobacteria bacterium]
MKQISIGDAIGALTFEFQGTTVRHPAFDEADPVSVIANVCQTLSVIGTCLAADEGDALSSLANSAFGVDVVYQACASLKWQLQLASKLIECERARALDALTEATQLRGAKLAVVPGGKAVPKKPAVTLDKKSWDAGYQAGHAGDCSIVAPGCDGLAWSSGFIEGQADRQAGKSSRQGDQT